ncbi:MAG: class I SAM-dependent methyltransferase [Patescibacteria group bacterium]|nr:class I SAM-dependent methyltransferase [Patescibacteria group bacterium]
MDGATIEAYDKMAKEYDEETSDFWKKFPRTFLNKFISLAGKAVLDVGSGPGRDGLIFKNAGLNVICLDASKSMVEISGKRGLESVLGDFNDLPFKDDSFDSAWAYTSLLHVPKAEIHGPLQEIRRVLKPNGVFGLGLIEGEGEIYRESLKVTKPRWFSYYQKGEVEKILSDNDFEILYFEQFKPNTRNYLNFISQKKDPS